MKFDTLVIHVKFDDKTNNLRSNLPDEHEVYGKLADVTLAIFDFDYNEEEEQLLNFILKRVLFTKCKRVIVISSNGYYVCDHLLNYTDLCVSHYNFNNGAMVPIDIIDAPFNLVSKSLLGTCDLALIGSPSNPDFDILERYEKLTNCLEYLNIVHRFSIITEIEKPLKITSLRTNKIFVYVNPNDKLDVKSVEVLKGHPQIEIVYVDSFNEVLRLDEERKPKSINTA